MLTRFGLIVFNLGLVILGPMPDATGKEETPDLPKAVQLIIDQTNEFRKQEKRPAVQVNKELTKAAEYFAKFMAKTGKYGHEADEKKPAERAKEHDYDYCIVLENIAKVFNSEGFSTEALASQFVKGWKESPGHRKNMLDPDVTDTGVAIARSEETGYYFAVQMFGRPKSKMLEFQIVNRSDAEVEYKIDSEEFKLAPRITRTHQVCRPPEVAFKTPKELTETKPLKLAGGEKLAVSGRDGKYEVKKE
jgi:cysteine-rich secretory family protein